MADINSIWLDRALDELVKVVARSDLTVKVEMLSGNASGPYEISAGDFYNSHEFIEGAE